MILRCIPKGTLECLLFSWGGKKQLIAASAVSPPSSWHKGKLRRDFRWLGACLLDEPFGILAYRSHQQSSTLPTSWPMLEPGEWAGDWV